ncbi:hypothetical protein [Paenibacillus sp. 7523-1]|uniref:hypothetical protein n=1 Tax=Paenibacillus sp. 7523-1 TaxID=2022550 RepID=UPI000BA52268|nr:hypothetical protein [Paenibacillus sp. 7523-1]PAD31882.1 hypothetical protein CHH60_08705 [Paenibacillus sp. 7523-1]
MGRSSEPVSLFPAERIVDDDLRVLFTEFNGGVSGDTVDKNSLAKTVYQLIRKGDTGNTLSQNINSQPLQSIKPPGKGDEMDESTKMMMERLERDSREREERYHKDAQEREQRFRDEIKEQADLYRQEAKEREERIEKMINGLSSEIKEVRSEASQTTKHVQSMVTSNTWGFIATVLAIVALTVTLFIALSPSNKGETGSPPPTQVESTK